MTQRPHRPTIAQIREVCQPPAIRGRKNSEHWVADVYLRDISPYLTRLLLRTPIIGSLVRVIAVERFTRVLSALSEAGVPLPDGNGLDWCRDLRAAGATVPMLVLSARSEEMDKVLGLAG